MQHTQEMWKWEVAGTMFVAALAMFFLSACGGSSKPTAADAQAIFESNHHKDVKVISFKLTRESDIREVEVDGKKRKVAFVEYEAEVECLQNIYVDLKPCKQGEKRTTKGMINFKNDGEGWKEPGT